MLDVKSSRFIVIGGQDLSVERATPPMPPPGIVDGRGAPKESYQATDRLLNFRQAVVTTTVMVFTTKSKDCQQVK